MSRKDTRTFFDVKDEELDEALLALEQKGWVQLNRDKKGIALAKATYDGLGRAFPPDRYKWFPNQATGDRIF